jgi:hypothetical protein
MRFFGLCSMQRAYTKSWKNSRRKALDILLEENILLLTDPARSCAKWGRYQASRLEHPLDHA